jgi:NAD(P)-binding Rossmann-like domain
MDADADFVVAGAGHNSLIAACYLAKAGYRCLVLDARPVPGGGCTTEELLLPGYGIDTCATGHTLIRVNPLLTGSITGAPGRNAAIVLLHDLGHDPAEVLSAPPK